MPTPPPAGEPIVRLRTAGRPALPDPDALPNDSAVKIRRLLLASERLGLTTLMDVVEAEDGAVTPVDIKTVKRPHVD